MTKKKSEAVTQLLTLKKVTKGTVVYAADDGAEITITTQVYVTKGCSVIGSEPKNIRLTIEAVE